MKSLSIQLAAVVAAAACEAGKADTRKVAKKRPAQGSKARRAASNKEQAR